MSVPMALIRQVIPSVHTAWFGFGTSHIRSIQIFSPHQCCAPPLSTRFAWPCPVPYTSFVSGPMLELCNSATRIWRAPHTCLLLFTMTKRDSHLAPFRPDVEGTFLDPPCAVLRAQHIKRGTTTPPTFSLAPSLPPPLPSPLPSPST